MMRLPASQRTNRYNEVLIDYATFERHLPQSIEAFFFDPAVGPGLRVRDTWRRFLQHYHLDATEVPLLRLVDVSEPPVSLAAVEEDRLFTVAS